MKGSVWYARLSVALILAIVGWCVIAVAVGAARVQNNTVKIEVHGVMIEGVREDLGEIKAEQISARLEQRKDLQEIKQLIREGG